LLGVLSHAAAPAVELIANGDFHAGLAGWRPLWTRDPGLGNAELQRSESGTEVLITHTGNRDWSFTRGERLPVKPGDMFVLSLGPYRVPDAGRDMQRIWTEVPERVAKFQIGHRYRLPLWELVYHDCVVAQWYWGDYNNKLPALWDKRDLFNALYGTPPMFMFNHRLWQENRERFVASYQAAASVARATGYSEMVDHRFLTPNRDVQQTRFANGVVVTVNFGKAPFEMADGVPLALGAQRRQIPGVSPGE